MTDPARIRAIAEEGLRLREDATPGPWEHDDCGTIRTTHGIDLIDAVAATEDDVAFLLHAGTHYEELCRAVLELLGPEPARSRRCAPSTPGRSATSPRS